MFSQIYRRPRKRSAVVSIGILLALAFLILSMLLLSSARATELSGQKLMAIFPTAGKFVERDVVLTAEQIVSIEKKLGTKLQSEDLKPIFYILLDDKNEPMGLVLGSNIKGPNGVIEGAVGVNMRGKVVKVDIYEHKETEAIVGAGFLKQFVGMGIDDIFKVGADIVAVEGHDAASNAVALIPKKTLVMSYALFHKREPKSEIEKGPELESPEEELPEAEDLKALMALMIDDYFVVVDYFDEKESKEKAVEASKRLAKYAKNISNFEPPKNADQTDEYIYLQDKFAETLLQFAEKLEQEGISNETREQWDAIVTLIDQAHLRFSEEEIDLDAY
ncbi:FMN-binding protein [Candidatus Poribacteria bacterium]|nr:FMN-binding protein [Candidatus Poribacteria bacterium]